MDCAGSSTGCVRILSHPTYTDVAASLRLAIFDAAWDATIGKGKLGVRWTDKTAQSATTKKGLDQGHLRSYAGEGKWERRQYHRRAPENDYLAQYRRGPQDAANCRIGPCQRSQDFREMPRGVSAATGSNYRRSIATAMNGGRRNM